MDIKVNITRYSQEMSFFGVKTEQEMIFVTVEVQNLRKMECEWGNKRINHDKA